MKDLQVRLFVVVVFFLFSMREEYGLPQSALKSVMSYTTQICQDSVLLAGQRIKRKLENRVDISDCLDLNDFPPFKHYHSDWLRNQFINQHFNVVVCTFED